MPSAPDLDAMGSLTPAVSILDAGQNTCVPWMSLLPLGDWSVVGLPKRSQVGRWAGVGDVLQFSG